MSSKIKSLDFMQNALKILINSFYGYFGFRNSRDYLYQIPDTITTSCRFVTKKTMQISKSIGLVPVWGILIVVILLKWMVLRLILKLLMGSILIFKDWLKQFGTIVEFEKNHPVTNELVKVCHTTEFNYEKFKNSIDIRKKNIIF